MNSQISEATTKKSHRRWLIPIIAVVAMLAIAAGALWAAGVFTRQADHPNTPEGVAKAFVEYYCLKNMPAYFPLTLHDSRQEWKDITLKGHESEEAFCQVVQQQADEQGLGYTVRSIDDYLDAFYLRSLDQMEEKYGNYTIRTEVLKHNHLDEAMTTAFREKVLGGFLSDYYDEDRVNAVTDIQVMEIGYTVNGTKDDYYETYRVYVGQLNGRWIVADYTR